MFREVAPVIQLCAGRIASAQSVDPIIFSFATVGDNRIQQAHDFMAGYSRQLYSGESRHFGE
jgi:hypothetical protein